jgi:PAS domain-containing protein
LRTPSLAAHRRALAGEYASFEVEWVGSAYQAQVGPMRDADGVIVGVIGVALDVTARRCAGGGPAHRRGT